MKYKYNKSRNKDKVEIIPILFTSNGRICPVGYKCSLQYCKLHLYVAVCHNEDSWYGVTNPSQPVTEYDLKTTFVGDDYAANRGGLYIQTPLTGKIEKYLPLKLSDFLRVRKLSIIKKDRYSLPVIFNNYSEEGNISEITDQDIETEYKMIWDRKSLYKTWKEVKPLLDSYSDKLKEEFLSIGFRGLYKKSDDMYFTEDTTINNMSFQTPIFTRVEIPVYKDYLFEPLEAFTKGYLYKYNEEFINS